MHKAYDKEGYGTPAYMKAQAALSDELMTIRFTAKTIEKLCDMVRAQVDDVRKKERELRTHHRGQVRHAAGDRSSRSSRPTC